MLIVLSAMLIFLILIICGDKGSKTIVTTGISIVLTLCSIYLIYLGIPPVPVMLALASSSACFIILFQNDFSRKAKVELLSSLIVILCMIPVIYGIACGSLTHGFIKESYEITDSNGFSRNIGLNMFPVQISILIVAMTGVVIDSSVAVTSSIYEIKFSNPHLSNNKLLRSGIHVGKAILNTSIHTIFYVYLAEYLTLIIQYCREISFAEMLNSKSFTQGIISISISGIACCLIIPVSALLAVFSLRNKY